MKDEVMKAYGFDSYNQTVEDEVAQTLRSDEGGDTKPKVLIVYEANNTNREKIF